MDTVEIIEDLIKESGKPTSTVLMDCRLSHNSIINWKSGRAKPSVDAVIKFAEYFGVTTDYLLGVEKKESNPVFGQLTEEEIMVIKAYRRVPKALQLQTFMTWATLLLNSDEKGDKEIADTWLKHNSNVKLSLGEILYLSKKNDSPYKHKKFLEKLEKDGLLSEEDAKKIKDK